MVTRRTASNGLETWMQLNSKKLLRRAMTLSKGSDKDCSSIPKLAQAAGVSTALIGFLVTDGKSARDTTTVENGRKIADALGWDFDELFTLRDSERAA